MFIEKYHTNFSAIRLVILAICTFFLLTNFFAEHAHADVAGRAELQHKAAQIPNLKYCAGGINPASQEVSYTKTDIFGPLPYTRTYQSTLSESKNTAFDMIEPERSTGGWVDNYHNYLIIEDLSKPFGPKTNRLVIRVRLPGQLEETFYVGQMQGDGVTLDGINRIYSAQPLIHEAGMVQYNNGKHTFSQTVRDPIGENSRDHRDQVLSVRTLDGSQIALDRLPNISKFENMEFLIKKHGRTYKFKFIGSNNDKFSIQKDGEIYKYGFMESGSYKSAYFKLSDIELEGGTFLGLLYDDFGGLRAVADNRGNRLLIDREYLDSANPRNSVVKRVRRSNPGESSFSLTANYQQVTYEYESYTWQDFRANRPLPNRTIFAVKSAKSSVNGEEFYGYTLGSLRSFNEIEPYGPAITTSARRIPLLDSVSNPEGGEIKKWNYRFDDPLLEYQISLESFYDGGDLKANHTKLGYAPNHQSILNHEDEYRSIYDGLKFLSNEGLSDVLVNTYSKPLHDKWVSITYSGFPCATYKGIPISQVKIDALYGNISRLVDYRRVVTDFEYDDNNRLKKITEAVGTSKQRITTYEYTVLSNGAANFFNTPNVIRQPHLTVENSLDPYGAILKQTLTSDLLSSQSRSTTYTYYGENEGGLFGLLKSIDGPRTDINDTQGFSYDDNGNLAAVAMYVTRDGTEKIVTKTFTSYNSIGKPAYIGMDLGLKKGLSQKFVYDVNFRLKSVTQGTGVGAFFASSGIVESYGYDTIGRRTKETLPDGEVYDLTYDALNRLIYKDQQGVLTDASTYHPSGPLKDRKIWTNRPGAETIVDYQEQFLDTNGRVARSTQGSSALGAYIETKFEYDANGNRIREIQNAPLDSRTSWLTTTIDYDELNRQTRKIDPNGDIITTVPDLADNVKSLLAANNTGSSQDFRDRDKKSAESNSDFGALQFRHDAAGNITSRTNGRSARCDYLNIDQLGRLHKESCSLAGNTTQNPLFAIGDVHVYDETRFGRLDRVYSDNNGMAPFDRGFLGTQTDYLYDDQDRIVGKKQVAGLAHKVSGSKTESVIGYSYSLGGKLNGMTLPSGKTVGYGYNGLGQIGKVLVNGSDLMTNMVHDGAGRLVSWQWGNGLTSTNVMNVAGQFVSSTTMNGTSRVLGLNYTHYADGNIKTQVVNGQTRTYSYDKTSQLTKEVGSNYTHQYSYDSNGNRLTGPNQVLTYVAGKNQIASFTKGGEAQGVSHCCMGVLQLASLGKQAYDYKNRRIWENAAGLASIMQYNHKNERTAKYVNGDFRLYMYDEASHLVGEYTVTGQPIVEYVWLGDTPIAALYPNNAVVYLLTDHQNKPRRGVDSVTKQVVWTWDPDAFGVFQPSLARVEVNLRFPGQYYDKHTGLYYNHNRYYNPQIGRYLEPDPIGLEGGLNPYAYADNNPVMAVDPSGLNPAWLVLGGIWILDNLRSDTPNPNNAPPSGVGDAAMAVTPVGRLTTVGAGKAAAGAGKATDSFVDLTAHRAQHILNRHRAGVGKSGKTEFPANWSDDQILHHVSDVATDPNAVRGLGKWDSPYAIATRDGIEIRVDFYPNNHLKYPGQISTAYPLNVVPNP